jgi:hypothetical protein
LHFNGLAKASIVISREGQMKTKAKSTITKYDTFTPTISELIHDINNGDIKIPDFQRPFVWKQDQIIELLDSIYRGFPIGTLLFWNSHEKLQSSRNLGGFKLPDTRPQYPVNYVLDGQQRLTALYGVFSKSNIAKNQTEYDIDPIIFDIYFDLDENKFVTKNNCVTTHKNVELKILLDNYEFNQVIKAYEETYSRRANELQNRLQTSKITIVRTYNRARDEVAYIFERINSTGTTLTTLDLMVAWTWSKDFHLREKIDNTRENLAKKKFSDIQDKTILQCIGAVVNKTAITKDILNLVPTEVRKNYNTVNVALEKAIDYLSTQFSIASRELLPHQQQIVPLAYFFSKCHKPSAKQLKILNNWFWRTSFSNRYADATDKKINEDISFLESLIHKSSTANLDKYRYSIDSQTLKSQLFSKGQPFTRATLLLLAQQKPMDLTNGRSIDLGEALSKYNRKEYHHIFPNNFLKTYYKGSNKINALANFTFLPADSNKIISDNKPSHYIFKKVPKKSFAKILSSNLMPLNQNIYRDNNYDNFLTARTDLILQALDRLLADL